MKTNNLIFGRYSVVRIVISFFFLLFCFAHLTQAQNINLTRQNIRIADAFEVIEQQSQMTIGYSESNIDVNKRISISLVNQSLSQALKDVLQGTNTTFRIQGRQILIVAQQPTEANQEIQRKIAGTVIDERGEAIIGANIIEKGTTNGVVTNIDGNFSISVPTNAILQFSYIGYINQEVRIENQNSLEVILKEDTQALDEVVVIGYGTARRKDITGSISTVKMADSPLALTSKTNGLEALRGTTPGINIGANTSAGQTPSMNIRGQNSLNGTNDPLIVLDGVIYMGNINDISPNDIASFEVLKDATSAASYGSRAANGVILINTKKGKVGKPVITFNTSLSLQNWQQRPKLLSSENYIRKVNAAQGLPEDADPNIWLSEPEKINYSKGETTDWVDLVTDAGFLQDYQVSVAGGGEKMNYYFSGSYTDHNGIVVGDNYDRFSVLSKLTTNITDWLEVGIDLSYTYRNYPKVAASLSRAIVMTPFGQPYRDEENKLLEKYPRYQGSAAINPLWGTDGTRINVDAANSFKGGGHALVKIPFIPGLSYRFNYVQIGDFVNRDRFSYEGYFVSEGDSPDRYSPSTLQGLLSKASGSLANVRRNSYVMDNIINYKREFLEKHYLDITLVNTRDYYKEETVTTKGTDYTDNGNTGLGVKGLHKAAIQEIVMDATKKTNIGYLARLQYTYDDKYHLTGTYRRDGSSVFGIDNKWGNFPAIGVAWSASNEEFLKRNEYLNYLKVKASYGKNGNQGIGPYGTLSQVINGSNSGIWYEFGNSHDVQYGMNISTLGNSRLGWETTTAWNGGFESSWFDNRIALDADFYISKTTDQLFTRQIPPMTGFRTIMASMGQINNWGVELNLRTTNIRNVDFEWNSGLTFWLNRNKLAKLYGDDIDGDGKEDDDPSNSLFIGKSLGAIYGYKSIGIVQVDDKDYITKNGAKPGDVKFLDLDGDEVITAEDRMILGYRKENFRMNLANTFKYKNMELYILVTGIFGGNGYYMQNNAKAYLTAEGGTNLNNILDHTWWTEENRNNVYPSATYIDGKFQGLQSRSFVRIQDLTFSYKFDEKVIRKLNISSLKLFVTGKNLCYFTKWIGGDPEIGQTISSDYPVPSSYSIGLNVSF